MVFQTCIYQIINKNNTKNQHVEKSKKLQETCNPFVTIIDNIKEVEITDNLLSGIPYGIKDNYSTKVIKVLKY